MHACRCSKTSDKAPEDSVDSPAEPSPKRVHLDQPEPRLDIVSYIAMTPAEKTDAKKYQVIVDSVLPDATYKFPKAANGRSFQYKWLSRYEV